METPQKDFLLTNLPYFVNNLEMSDDFIEELFNKDLLSLCQKEKICAQQTRTEKASMLMTLLPRRGPDAFNIFQKTLKEHDIKVYCFLTGEAIPERLRESNLTDFMNGNKFFKAIFLSTLKNWSNAVKIVNELEKTNLENIALISTKDLQDWTVFNFVHKMIAIGKPIFTIGSKDLEKDYFSQVMVMSLTRLKQNMNIILLEDSPKLQIFKHMEIFSWCQQKSAIGFALFKTSRACNCLCHRDLDP